jgi:O-antigen ligase
VCLLSLWMLRRRLGRFKPLVLSLLIPLFLAAIFVTYTRCAWIAAGLCSLVVLGLPMSNQRRIVFVSFTFMAAVFLAAFQWDNLVYMERAEGVTVSEMSAKARVSFAYVSWKMFLDSPLLGVGYGQFQEAAKPYLSDRSTSLYLEDIRDQPNHNTFLAVLNEIGLVGFGLFTAMFSGWVVQSWRLWRNTAACDWVREQGLMMLGVLVIYLSIAMSVDIRFGPEAQQITFFLAGLTSGVAAGMSASVAKCANEPAWSGKLEAGR